MSVALPKQTVYYYECSYGDFRLTYFMPPVFLEQLISEDRIHAAVLEDFPDGVDLGCTEADFDEFEETYGYRHSTEPRFLRAAFLALYSSTHDWQNYHGTGLVPAVKLERIAAEVAESIEPEIAEPPAFESLVEPESLDERRERLEQQTENAAAVQASLEALAVEGVNPDRSMGGQDFGEIAMDDGENVLEVYSRLQLKQRR